MFFIVDACFFVMWIGAWSACHGLGAIGTGLLWTAVMAACLLTELRGNWRVVADIVLKGRPVAPIIIAAVAVWALYFVGLGDALNYLMPRTFPSEGVLFLPAKCGLVQCAMAIAWTVARLPFVRIARVLYPLVKASVQRKVG